MNDVIYDNFSFVENGCVLTNIDHLTVADRDNQLETLANRNGAKLVQSQLGTKPIYIEGYYIGSSPADAQEMYDTLVAALNRQERPLIVPHAGGTRRYIATPKNVILKQPDGLNRLTFDFEFVVPEGSSTSLLDLTLISATITTPSATLPLNVLGSATARPLTRLVFNAVTGGTAKTVSVRNAKDYVGMTFTRTFVAGDTILIDSDNFRVYVNDDLVEPTGRFPAWGNGSGGLYYSDTFTTRSVSILTTYKRKDN